MKTQELRNLSLDELLHKRNALKEELHKLNYQRRSGTVQKPHRFQLIRKDIARTETVLRERQLNIR